MKTKLLITILFLSVFAFSANAQNTENEKGYEIGASLKYWMPGDMYFIDDVKKEGGIFLNAYADYNIVPKFAVGAYFNFGPSFSVEEADQTGQFSEIGMQLKIRIFAGNIKICPALQIGYRGIKIEDIKALKTDGFAVNMNTDIVIPTKSKILLVPSIGFLAQPVGGNDIGDVTFAPIPYIGFGISF
ncbi:MAG: outer membrane beta-barrel protein [Bacteroidales bacterium]